ncbi:MAG: cysteine--tRNA ligase [Calditrichaeota bacterium]|nr:MAG: cysteine--tRNA ligase [Calditrichota bacterium]
MAIQIFNTLGRKKEAFVPLTPGRVYMYVCGPTVYSHPHLGHAKSYISFDAIVRYFRYRGFRVKYVQNITDVGHLTDDADSGEDKIIKKAREEKLDPMEVAQYYTWSYFDDMDALGVLRPNISPHATGHIIEQIELIKTLLKKGYAYEVGGSVYFDITRFPEYGKLSGRKLEELEAGARIEVNPDKRNPFDFALWKHADPAHLMKWPSPWGLGYPGWHIECSAMSMKYLGETFDIHGGGLDNVFPHHECEIAQSEAATGRPFVRYWMHNNLVTVNGVKMSKSLGNFITIKEALQKYSPNTIRYFVLSSHYRSPLDFSDQALNGAQRGLERLVTMVRRIRKALSQAGENTKVDPPFEVEAYRKRFEAVMDDDFNTPQAIAVLFELVKRTQDLLGEGKASRAFLEGVDALITDIGQHVLGLLPQDLSKPDSASLLPVVEKLIQITVDVRSELRKQKLWPLSDKIRQELASLGIVIKDRPDGSTEWEHNF